jgi:hypothetical protein
MLPLRGLIVTLLFCSFTSTLLSGFSQYLFDQMMKCRWVEKAIHGQRQQNVDDAFIIVVFIVSFTTTSTPPHPPPPHPSTTTTTTTTILKNNKWKKEEQKV